MITAFVLVHADADRIPETAQAIADLEGVAEVYSCAGDVDLVAVVRVREKSSTPWSSSFCPRQSRRTRLNWSSTSSMNRRCSEGSRRAARVDVRA